MTLARLTELSERLAATRSRREKIELLARALTDLAPEEHEAGAAFLCGETRQGKTGIGRALVGEALEAAAVPGPPVTLAELDGALAEIAGRSGPGSASERERRLAGLFARAGAGERRYLASLLSGELRQGALEGLLAEALARAAGAPAGEVRRAWMLAGRGAVVRAALAEGRAGLAHFDLTPLRPIQPMLAQSAADLGEALARLGEAALEFKLDGARIQLHRQGHDVRVFSRGCNDVTAAVPELVELALALPARELVLDGEALALGRDGSPLPFQTTMRRFGRRLDVARLRAERPLSAFFFDCLYLDGESLIDRPDGERHHALAALVPAEQRVPRRDALDGAAADAFLAEALARGHEGVMAKAAGAAYAAGSRGAAWLKVKPAHTLDLVVIAAEWGSGRRRGWLSNLHLAARAVGGADPVMLGKTFKGMSDEMLAWQTERLLALQTAREGNVVRVRPELVVEVAFDGVQTSPHYPGGVTLRFARVRRYRDDKTAEQADTIDAVRALARRAPPEE